MNRATTHCRHCPARQPVIAPSIPALVAALEAVGWRSLVVWPRSLGGTCPGCADEAAQERRYA